MVPALLDDTRSSSRR